MDAKNDTERVAIARQLDWYDREFRTHSEYDVYDAIRGVPAQQSEKTGEWFVLGYDDTREAFLDTDVFRNSLHTVGEQLGRIPAYPVNTDGAVHAEYRRLLTPLFTAKRMGVFASAMRGYAVSLLEPLADSHRADLAVGFTIPFPAGSFCRLMGFPPEDYARLLLWKDAYLNSKSPEIAARFGITDVGPDGRPSSNAANELSLRTGAEVSDYLRPLIAERRAHPQDDVLSDLVQVQHQDGTPLTDDELVSIGFNLVLGGLDTVSGTLSMIVRHFAEHPAGRTAFQSLADDEDRLARAVEELMRFHSIVTMPRRVAQTCTFRGAHLKAGDTALLVTPAANRDPTKFDRADQLDFDRHPNQHIGFGVGVHRCLGIHLARIELRIALQELHRLIPNYRLDPEHPPVVASGAQRGLFSLPVLIGRGAVS